MNSGNAESESLTVQVKVGAGNAESALIGAVESTGDGAGGIDVEMKFYMERAECSRVIAGDIRDWLREYRVGREGKHSQKQREREIYRLVGMTSGEHENRFHRNDGHYKVNAGPDNNLRDWDEKEGAPRKAAGNEVELGSGDVWLRRSIEMQLINGSIQLE